MLDISLGDRLSGRTQFYKCASILLQAKNITAVVDA